MAPNYKLHHLNVTSLGEPIRFLLSYGNKDFEDIRYSPEDWLKHKSEMPLGRVPVLEFDGKRYFQALALSRYLGTEYGIAGETGLENLQIDIAMYTYGDLRQAVVGWFYDRNEQSKASKYDPLIKEQLPMYLGKLEEMAKENGGFLANGKLSWADIFFSASLKYYNALLGFDMLEAYPVLKELKRRIECIPQISSYIARRPKTEK